jgi:hypothetical protein
MRIEGYELHLYCDSADAHPCNYRFPNDPDQGKAGARFPVKINATCKRVAYRLANRAGWRLGEVDYCPSCAKRLAPLKPRARGPHPRPAPCSPLQCREP